jgi:hypothetical protein
LSSSRAPSDGEEEGMDGSQDSGDERGGFAAVSDEELAAMYEHLDEQRDARKNMDSFEAVEGGSGDEGDSRMGGDED